MLLFVFAFVEFYVVAVCPELFKTVEHSCVVVEDVHDDSAVVKDNPLAFLDAVHAQTLDTMVFVKGVFKIFSKGFDLSV